MSDETTLAGRPATLTLPRADPRPLGAFERAARALLLRRLTAIERGHLQIAEGGEVHSFGRGGGPSASVAVLDPALWTAVAARGSVGAGEAYVAGHWRADDLAAVMRVFTLNRELLDGLEGGPARVARATFALGHELRRNTRGGSRRNISAHYDLGNDFFSLFLDETMMYSAAIFDRPDASLFEASVTKIDRLCRKLDLQPGEHLLEIGTGWGALAVHAAERYGCSVTTTTISRQQYDLARERVERHGLDGRIRVLLEDYRDLTGTYDKLVSVEMIEAVGHAYYPSFFRACAERLRPQGRMALQAITIADSSYERARRGVDFIKRYIFPGSNIPSTTALLAAATAASDLRLVHLEDITPHYARTLAAWRSRLLARSDDARALGYGDDFLRMWEYYLALCEGGFAERYLGDVQMVFSRPDSRHDPIIGELS